MKQNKIDYPYCTRAGETSEIHESVKSQADVNDYYRTYGIGTFIWHESWDDAFKYVMHEIKKQKKHLQNGLTQYRKTEKELILMNKLKNLRGQK